MTLKATTNIGRNYSVKRTADIPVPVGMTVVVLGLDGWGKMIKKNLWKNVIN